jgi:hypothetical protein
MQNVQILFPNASKVGSGGDLVPGENSVTFDINEGARLGFFVVSNAHGKGYENREALESTTGRPVLKRGETENGEDRSNSGAGNHRDQPRPRRRRSRHPDRPRHARHPAAHVCRYTGVGEQVTTPRGVAQPSVGSLVSDGSDVS